MKVHLQNQSQTYLKKKNMHEDAIANGSPNRSVIKTALQDARKQRQGAMDGLELVMHNREVLLPVVVGVIAMPFFTVCITVIVALFV